MEVNNRLLRAFADDDQAALLRHLEPIDAPYRLRLERPMTPITDVYFVQSGIVSVLYKGQGTHTADVAIIGNEGCTGCPVILGTDRSPQGSMMQSNGSALRIATSKLWELFRERPSIREMLLQYVYTTIIQRDETALAASKATLVQRLARWLLMTQDRLHTDRISLTHDTIAVMLACRRAGVTLAIGTLRDHGLIDTGRGAITIRDRNGLQSYCEKFYGAAEAEYERVIAQRRVRRADGVGSPAAEKV